MMAQADPPKDGDMFERMNDRIQFVSNKMTHYFIEWTNPSGLLKKIYYPFKKFDTSNRSS